MTAKALRSFAPHSLGHVFEDADITAFFGHRGSDAEALSQAFPDFTLSFIKQTHSDIIIPAEGAEGAEGARRISVTDRVNFQEADAQFTNERRVALCIRTADCVPVLIFDKESGFIAAAHAGWRGVANEIVIKTGRALQAKGINLKSARAFIGPHIGVKSFEVGDDVAELLEKTLDAVRSHTNEQTAIVLPDHLGIENSVKKHVDLTRIVRAQLSSIGIGRERTLELPIDTVTSAPHESFRRDRERGGRQTSFISLK